ncbi:MAG: 3TM-type holin [Pseudomonadota bacterium]
MIAAFIPALSDLLGKVIDRAVPDRDQANKLRAELTTQLLSQSSAELQGAVDIIKAEAQGSSWLQRNWRPILMLTIVAIVANNYLVSPWLNAIFGADTAPILDLPERLWALMNLGVGGYVAGRSGEKMVALWRGKEP